MYQPADPERALRLRRAIAEADLDALLAWRPEEIVLTTRSYPHMGATLCVYPRSGDPVIFAPDVEPPAALPPGLDCLGYPLPAEPGLEGWQELRRVLLVEIERRGIGGRLGYVPEMPGVQHAPAGNAAESTPLSPPVIAYLLNGDGVPAPEDATIVVARLMQRKTPQEVDALRRANRIAQAGLRAFDEHLRPGQGEAALAGLVEAVIGAETGYAGTHYVRAWASLRAGPRALEAGPAGPSSGRRIEPGDMAVLEVTTCVDGYWSDLTRTAIAGEPAPEQRALLQTVRDAQDAAIAVMRAGVPGAAVDQAARDLLAARGYGAGFAHATGHPVGFRCHDPGAMLAPEAGALLEEGMVMAVGPGSYGAAFGGGACWEDDVYVDDVGAEVLSA